MKDSIRIWGEVIIDLINVKTGLTDKHIVVKNTLMNRFIDFLVGMTGNAYGVGMGSGQTDQRHAWNKWRRNAATFFAGPFPGPLTVFSMRGSDFPRAIVLGSGSTAFVASNLPPSPTSITW